MKRLCSLTLSVLLCIAMFSGGLQVAVSADGGTTDLPIGSVASDYTPDATATAVSSFEDFSIMAADGNYYLTQDIMVETTYETTFVGTFDGCGYNIRIIGNPIFTIMNGTVKNLTITGYTTRKSAGNIGALAISSTGGAVVTNVRNGARVENNVDVSSATADGCVGGIIGRIGTVAATFTNCLNTAHITGPEATGGIVGENQVLGTTFTGCGNTGNITSRCNDSGVGAGGIMGYSGTNLVYFVDCNNEGTITSNRAAGGIAGDARKYASFICCNNTGLVKGASSAGGILGYAGDSGTATQLVIDVCYNSGNVISSAGQAGGIAGYIYGGGNMWAVLTNSVNTGNVSGTTYLSEFISYTNSAKTTIRNCIGCGEVFPVGETALAISIFNCSSAAIEQAVIENVFLVDGGATEWYTWAAFATANTIDDANADNRIPLTAILGKDLSGSTYTYNTYTDSTYTVIATADNSMTYTDSAETPVNVKAVTRADAVTADMVTTLNTALGGERFYLIGGTVFIEPALELKIITQPTDYTGLAGSEAMFWVEAEGSVLSYQWQILKGKTWVDATSDGNDSDYLWLTATESRAKYQYRCVITDGVGATVTTDPVTMTIVEPGATITTQPVDFEGTIGLTATFSVVAENAVSYQWQILKGGNWVDAASAGSDEATFSLVITEGRVKYGYRCVITDADGYAVYTDAVKMVIVQPALEITSQPADFNGETGTPATFAVEATGAVSYQWQIFKSGKWVNAASAGNDEASFTLSANASRAKYLYRCVVTDSNGYSLVSDAVSMTIATPMP